MNRRHSTLEECWYPAKPILTAEMQPLRTRGIHDPETQICKATLTLLEISGDVALGGVGNLPNRKTIQLPLASVPHRTCDLRPGTTTS